MRAMHLVSLGIASAARRHFRVAAELSTTAAGYRAFGQPGAPESDWPGFFAWLLLSLGACAAIMALARAVLPLALPRLWKEMLAVQPAHAIGVPKNVTEWWPAFVVPALVWQDVAAITAAARQTPWEALYLLPTPGIWRGTGAALGYMLFDCGVMLTWPDELRASVGGAMIKQLWFHHLFSLFLWPFSLHSSCAAFWVGWFLLSEGSNVLLNARTLLLKFQRGSSRAFIGVSAGFLVSFFLLRIAPIPLLAAGWARADWSHTTPATFAITALTTPLPVLLNIYWFGLALKGALKMLRPRKTREQ
jgi:hypothetical protein